MLFSNNRCSKAVRSAILATAWLLVITLSCDKRLVSQSKKFASGCMKCLKLFFGFLKYSRVTGMLLQFRLPSFDTVMYNI